MPNCIACGGECHCEDSFTVPPSVPHDILDILDDIVEQDRQTPGVSYRCTYCGFESNTRRGAMRHRKTHRGVVIYGPEGEVLP